MSKPFQKYNEAKTYAQNKARETGVDHGIDKTLEFNKIVYNVKMIPKEEFCCGHELRMERVRHDDPASLRKIVIFNKILKDYTIEIEGNNKFCNLSDFIQYWAMCADKPFEDKFYVISRG